MVSLSYRRVVDLSQEVSPATQMFPGYPQPALIPWTTRVHHGYLTEAMFMVTHTGTHVDAPWHYRPEGRKVHELSPAGFVARCHILDVRPKRAKARIGAVEIRRAISATGFRKREALLLRTGWERMRGRGTYLSGNPALDRGGAEAIVRAQASLVGVDSANIDLPDATDYPAHHAILGAGIPVVENLANVGAIGATAFTLVALPLRLRGAGGSPVRAVAFV